MCFDGMYLHPGDIFLDYDPGTAITIETLVTSFRDCRKIPH